MFHNRTFKGLSNLVLLVVIFSVTWITPAYAATNTITLDGDGDVGVASSLVLSSHGFPVISYYDQTNGDLKLAICSDATCTIKSIVIVDSTGDVGSFSSLALNSNGFPVISYWDATNLDLKLAVCSDINCTTPTITIVDSVGWQGMHTSLILNSNDYPVISYLENDNGGNLKIAVCTDTICTSPTITTVDSEGDVGLYTSLILNSNGYPVISYFDNTNLDLKVAVCSDAICASKTLTTVDSTGDVGRFNSLALNSSGFPVISYTDNTNYDLKLAVCSDIICTSKTLITVASGGFIGYYTSLALNSNDFPVIVFQEFMFGDLYVAICSDTACSNKTLGTVDTVGDTGQYASLELNSNEEPVISYYDNTNHDLKLASITSPKVVNIIRKDKNPTNASNVNFTITFSESVTGVDLDDFALTTNGLTSASITSVSSGAGSIYTVTVNTGSGDGTIRLDLVDNDSILNSAGMYLSLGGIGTGNGDFTSGEFYDIDRTRPTVSSITRSSANPSNATIVDFSVKFSEDMGFFNGFALTATGITGASIIDVSGTGGTYTVSVDTGTGNGIIRLDVRAYLEDLAGNSLGAPYSGEETYTIDKTSPDTQIDSQPDSPNNDSTPTITFSSNDSIGNGIASFMCNIDGQTYALCTSPFTSLNLADGSHTFDVYAIDLANNVDASPASSSWALDTVAPNTTIITKPASLDKDNTPTFTFSGNDGTGSGIGSFMCRMDSGTYTLCTSPFISSILSDGAHTIDVYAVDVANNADASPASYSWILDTIAPNTTIITKPASLDTDNTPTFTFSGNDGIGSGIASFMCRMDSGAYALCASSFISSALSNGAHTFDVYAIDMAGNVDASPALFFWTIDATAPIVKSSILFNANPTNLASVQFTAEFSESVNNVDVHGPAFDDFILTTTGVTGASITGVSGSGTTYMVTVNTGSGSGTVRLDVVDNNSIVDAASNPLGGAAMGDGNFITGEVYTVAKPSIMTVSNSGTGSGTVVSSPVGINCGVTCSYAFANDTVVTLTASPTPPSTFTGWSEGVCSGTGTCIITMSSAQSVTANFNIASTTPTTLVNSVLPTSRTVPVGTMATIFNTVINAGVNPATGVILSISPAPPGTFTYQQTSCATNAILGGLNPSLDLAAGGVLCYVLSFTPSAVFAATSVHIRAQAANAPSTNLLTGINTWLLRSTAVAGPDIIALTTTTDFHQVACSGINAFAVALSNVGAAATGNITVTANTGLATLPVTVLIQETEPATGVVIGTDVLSNVTAGNNRTVAVFVTFNGCIAFDPAANRIFIEFKDANGNVVGSTSTAVSTGR